MSPCDQCGQLHKRTIKLSGAWQEIPSCAGHRRRVRPLAPCGQPAAKGQRTCKLHGGASPNAIAKAQEVAATRKVEGDLNRVLAHQGITGVTDPFGELARLASEAIAFKDALAARVNALNDVSYVATGAGTEQLRAELALYERALDRTGRFLDSLVKGGFEERRVRIDEQIGAEVAGVIQRVLAALDLTAAQRAMVPTIVPGELRALEGGRAS